jgi:hypothetical protein
VNTANVGLAARFEFKSQREFLHRNLSLAVRTSSVDVVAVESFVKHHNRNVAHRAKVCELQVLQREPVFDDRQKSKYVLR